MPGSGKIYQETLISEFISVIADEKCLEDLDLQIEEEKVVTMPEKLIVHASLLLNGEVQRRAKTFFSNDGWLCVKNTLRLLQGKHFLFNPI